MKLLRLVCFILLFTVMPICFLSAGVVIVIQQKDANGVLKNTTQIHADGDRLRIEQNSKENQRTLIIFTGPSRVQIADLSKGMYQEFTEQDFARLKTMRQTMQQQVANLQQRPEIMEQLKKNLKHLPPEQQNKLNRHFENTGNAPIKNTVFQRVTGGIKVNQWECELYEGIRQGQKVQDVWTIDWRSLGISASDFQAFNNFGKQFGSIAGKEYNDRFQIGTRAFEERQGYPGIAVKKITYDQDGRIKNIEMITQMTHQTTFKQELFMLPATLKRTENMPEKMGLNLKPAQN